MNEKKIAIAALLLACCALVLPVVLKLKTPAPKPDPALAEVAAFKAALNEQLDALDSRVSQMKGDLDLQLSTMTQQIEALQQQTAEAGADDERITQLSNDLHNLNMAVNTLTQRIAQPQARSTAAARKATVKRPAPKPTQPSFNLENIDQFGGKTYAVINTYGERKFLAGNDELDGWRLDALSGSTARFVHLDTGATATLAPQ